LPPRTSPACTSPAPWRDVNIYPRCSVSRGRLIRHLLTEGLVVSIVAAFIAWGLALLSVAAVQGVVFSLVTDAGMSMLPVAVDARIVTAAFLLAIVVGVGCSLLPALQTTQMKTTIVLKRDGLFLGGATSLLLLQVAMSFSSSAQASWSGADKATQVDTAYNLDGCDLRRAPSTALIERLRQRPDVRRGCDRADPARRRHGGSRYDRRA
jgi:hypothetical protein